MKYSQGKHPNSRANLTYKIPKGSIPWNKGLKGFRAGQRRKEWLKIICKCCSKEFEVRPSDASRIFCSDVCSRKSNYPSYSPRHTQPHSLEAKAKMRLAKLGKRLSPSTEFKKGEKNPYEAKRLLSLKRGEDHHKWAGDSVGYHGVHSWIEKVKGKPSVCEECGTKTAKAYHWHNSTGDYLRDISDWERLCTVCHAHRHKNWQKRWGVAHG